MVPQLVVSRLALGSISALARFVARFDQQGDRCGQFRRQNGDVWNLRLLALFSKIGLPLAIVLALAVPIGAVLGVVTERLAMRPLQSAPPINALIATIGLSIISITAPDGSGATIPCASLPVLARTCEYSRRARCREQLGSSRRFALRRHAPISSSNTLAPGSRCGQPA